jgi:hypothetical protein
LVLNHGVAPYAIQQARMSRDGHMTQIVDASKIHLSRLAAIAVSLAVLLAAGCAQRDLDLGRGGLSAEDDAQLSLALAQVRAQAPKGHISGLVYEAREQPAGLEEPELALVGEGDSLKQGFQSGQSIHLKLSVYLDKSSYTRGYLKVARAGGAEEVWKIVAYLLRGQADQQFQFTYLVAEPNGALRTLMLIGGDYPQDADSVTALEGVLFVPPKEPRSKRYAPADWDLAYPITFWRDEPAEPAFQQLTAQSQDLVSDLERDSTELPRLAKRLDDLRAAAANGASETAAPASQDATAAPAPKPKDPRQDEAELKLREQSAAAQDRIVHYFALRGEADTAFAEYLTGNPFRWRDADGKDDAFTQWAAPEAREADVEALIADLLPYVPTPLAIDKARAEFRAVVAKNHNATKRPSTKDAP